MNHLARKSISMLFIFIGTFLIGYPIFVIIVNLMNNSLDSNLLDVLFYTIPGILFWFAGLKVFNNLVEQEISDKTSSNDPVELSYIKIIRITSNLELITNRLFKVIMLIAPIFGFLATYLLVAALTSDITSNSSEDIFLYLIIIFFSLIYIILLNYGLKLYFITKQLKTYNNPLEQEINLFTE